MHMTLIGAAAIATFCTAAPAFASDPAPKTASVRLDDLDLARAGDARILNRRVARAKEAVCGSYAGARDEAELRITECRASIDRQLEPRLAAMRAGDRLASR